MLLFSSALNYFNCGLGDGGGFPPTSLLTIRRGRQSKAAYDHVRCSIYYLFVCYCNGVVANPGGGGVICVSSSLLALAVAEEMSASAGTGDDSNGHGASSRAPGSPLTGHWSEKVLVTLMGLSGHFAGLLIRILK